MTTSILFVCLGNICRSPSAEAVLRAKAPDLAIDSAGTGDWHVGNPPYAPMRAVASRRGYLMDDLRARQVNVSDFHRFDRIIGMDADNMAVLRNLAPPDGTAKLSILTSHATNADAPDAVPDPYFTRDFEGALDLIEHCIDGLLADLRRGRA